MQIIGVRLKKAGRILFFEPDDSEIVKGDSVIVETSRGIECAQVVIAPRELPESENVETEPGLPLQKIQRKATEEDLLRLEENRAAERRAFDICLKKIEEHALPMKLINVEFTFDVNKIIFSFTADGRVDFRELVRDLAAIFRTRIELRQVGVRDEAKLLGGMGGCGRPLCCASFLGEFIPVSIRMAKDQNLSLNPTKISGVCGRLMCCLKYENDLYCENCPTQNANVILRPKVGSRVVVADGEGKVVSENFARRNATILLDTNRVVIANWDEILPVNEEDMEAVETPAQVEQENSPKEIPTKPVRHERRERYERTERYPRIERTERTEQTEHYEQAERSERYERRERPRRTEAFNRRYNRNENSERLNRNERPPRSPRTDKPRRPRRDPKK
ncbi:MAG: stage 0 sporulation family protein [Selenomonadaceae bacterium]|nr:stage 0 sporulation family protein [Selenomonadaceae bacterium]